MKNKKRNHNRKEKACEAVFFIGLFMAIGFIGGAENAANDADFMRGIALAVASLLVSFGALLIGGLTK